MKAILALLAHLIVPMVTLFGLVVSRRPRDRFFQWIENHSPPHGAALDALRRSSSSAFRHELSAETNPT